MLPVHALMPIKPLLLAALMAASFPGAQAAVDVSPKARLQVQSAWSRELPPNAQSLPAYFSIRNPSPRADALLSADTPVAGRVELHGHSHSNGMLKMQALDRVAVPAGETVDFAPGGYHLMLLDLKAPLRAGQRFPLTLHFQQAGDLRVEVPVQRDAPAASDQGQHHHH